MRGVAAAVLGLFLLAAGCGRSSVWTVPVAAPDPVQLASAAPSGRLPATAVPEAYRVLLEVDPRQSGFSGRVEIDIALKAAANGIWLHGRGLDIVSVTALAGGETVAASWHDVLESGVAWVGFPRRLEADRVTLVIDYAGAFDTALAGLFRVESQGRWYALAKSESIQARGFLPGFDEPGYKAVFDIALTVPEGMQAIANTPLVGRQPAGEGYETLTFAPTRPLPTYLLSVAVGPFEQVTRPDLAPGPVRAVPVPLAGYARPGKVDQLAYALDLTPEMMRVFEEMLGQPYPYAKLDLIAAPQWPSGATELAGAITYREGRILVPDNAGAGLRRSVSEIHAHEIAHMWFGNLVTPPWWDDLWLKEAFATWSETAVLSQMEPEAGHELNAVRDGLRAMALDSLDGVRAVAEPVGRNEDVRSAYDAITYSKGQSVIRMVDSYFGPDVLRPALGRYLASHADGEADSLQFFEAISQASGEPRIGKVFRSFVTRPGVPRVEVRSVCGRGRARLELSQSRYLPIGSSLTEDQGGWTIPVCTLWQDGASAGRVCTLLDQDRKTVDIPGAICPQVIVPNAAGAGYYRFDLEPAGWHALAAALPALGPGEALVSLDSAGAALLAGRLALGDYLDLLGAGAAHPDPAVLMAALDGFELLFQRLEGEDQPLRDLAQARLAGRGVPDDSEAADRLLVFRALWLRDPASRAGLRAGLDTFLSGRGGLTSDLYAGALQVDIEEGGPAAFGRAFALLLSEEDAVLRQAAAGAIGAVTDPVQAQEVLDSLAGGRISQQVSLSVLRALMRNPLHRDLVWERMEADLDGLARHIPAQARRDLPRLAAAFCDADRSGPLGALFAGAGPMLAGHERALAETRQGLVQCAAQRAHLRGQLAGLPG